MARKRDEKRAGRSQAGGSSAGKAGRNQAPSASAKVGTPASVGPVGSRAPALARGTTAKGLGNARPPRPTAPSRTSRQRVIPDAVANRMARRIAIATGIPTVMGMGVFIASYLVVSRGLLDIAPAATLLASGGCFLLGLVGLSYGVLSSSWEDAPGSLLGAEQIGVNIVRLRESIRAMRQGGTGASGGDSQG